MPLLCAREKTKQNRNMWYVLLCSIRNIIFDSNTIQSILCKNMIWCRWKIGGLPCLEDLKWDHFFLCNFQAKLSKGLEMNCIHLAVHLAYFVWKHLCKWRAVNDVLITPELWEKRSPLCTKCTYYPFTSTKYLHC